MRETTTTNHRPGGMVRVARRLMAQSPVRVRLEDIAGFDVEMTVVATPMEEERPGRLVVDRLCVTRREGGPAVTSEGLRGVPVTRLAVDAAADQVLLMEAGEEPASAQSVDLSSRRLERVRLEGPVPDSLELVAYLYELAYVKGAPPTNAVAETLDIPRSTAGRWVALARERGHLSPADAYSGA